MIQPQKVLITHIGNDGLNLFPVIQLLILIWLKNILMLIKTYV